MGDLVVVAAAFFTLLTRGSDNTESAFVDPSSESLLPSAEPARSASDSEVNDFGIAGGVLLSKCILGARTPNGDILPFSHEMLSRRCLLGVVLGVVSLLSAGSSTAVVDDSEAFLC